MSESKAMAGSSTFWASLTTHSVIPFIALISLLAAPESDRIINDILFWLLVFFWNLHLLFLCCFFYRASYLKEKGYFIRTIIIGSLGLLFWLANMIFITIITFTSPVFQKGSTYIFCGVLISAIMVSVALYLFFSLKYKNDKELS